MTSETYPSGRVVSTGYDGAGREVWLQGNQGGVTSITSAIRVMQTPGFLIGRMAASTTTFEAIRFGMPLRSTSSCSQPKATNNSEGQVLFVSCPDWGENSNNGFYSMCPTSSGTRNNKTLKNSRTLYGGPGYPSLLGLSPAFNYDGTNLLSSIQDSGGYSLTFADDTYGNISVTAPNGINLSPLTLCLGHGSNLFNGNNQLHSDLYGSNIAKIPSHTPSLGGYTTK